MTQKCVTCEVRVPSGFTHCDSCYYKTDEAKKDETTLLKNITNLEALESRHSGSYMYAQWEPPADTLITAYVHQAAPLMAQPDRSWFNHRK